MLTFRAFRHRNFALLISGQTLSRVGDFLYQIALAWWVLEKTDSGVAMSMVFIFTSVPNLLFLLLGGVLADRMSRVRLLFLSDIGRGVIMAVVAWLAFADRLELWMIYVGSLFFGFADAFFMPALQALVPQVTPKDDLISANSLNSLSMQLGRVAGPGIGGLLVGFGGTTLAFGINAISFFIAALSLIPLLSIPAPARTEEAGSTPAHLLAELGDGFRTNMASPILWITILVAAFLNITLAGPFSVGMPFLVQDHLGGDEKLLGLLYSIFPIGYAVASLITGTAKRLRYRGVVFYLGCVAAGLGLGMFGLDIPLWGVIVGGLVNGAALEVVGLVWINILQELVPEEKLGRVFSIDSLGSFALLPLGFALTGWLVDLVDVSMIFLGAGLAAVFFSLLPLLHPAIRKLD